MSSITSEEPYDLLCVGTGPASLAIAVALAEHNDPTRGSLQTVGVDTFSSLGGLQDALTVSDAEGGAGSSRSRPAKTQRTKRPIKTCFVEKHERFEWHPGMQLEGSTMQISFLKDLATTRDPTSPYTFLAYLRSISPSRLLSFISVGSLTPSRREFTDYLTWAAEKTAKDLSSSGGKMAYGEVVEAVEAVLPSNVEADIELLKVSSRTRDGTLTHRYTRNLLVSTGGSPRLPRQLSSLLNSTTERAPPRIIHSSAYLDHVDRMLDAIVASPSSEGIKISVIGAGQSSAEIFLALRNSLAKRLSTANTTVRPQIILSIRRSGLRPADDSPFSNEVFDPGMSQKVFALGDSGAREKVLKEAQATNYSVVNPTTLQSIYETMYAQKVDDDIYHRNPLAANSTLLDPQLVIRPYSSLTFAHTLPDSRTQLTFSNVITSENWSVDFDLVVAGTGYLRHEPAWNLLFPPAPECQKLSGTSTSLDRLFPTRSTSAPPKQRAVHLPLLSHFGMSASAASTSTDLSTSSSRLVSSQTSPPSTPPSGDDFSSIGSSGEKEDKLLVKDRFQVAENYRLQLPAEFEVQGRRGTFKPTVWLQGSNERTHGISDSLLSVLAVRASEVVDGLLKEGNL